MDFERITKLGEAVSELEEGEICLDNAGIRILKFVSYLEEDGKLGDWKEAFNGDPRLCLSDFLFS